MGDVRVRYGRVKGEQVTDDKESIRQWEAEDGTVFIDKGDGERIIVKPDRDDPSIAGETYETGGGDDE